MSQLFRSLPSVDRLSSSPPLARFPETIRTHAARLAIEEFRAAIREGRLTEAPQSEAIAARASAIARSLDEGSLKAVINATGVVIHTNLGRAPWSESARAAAMRAAGYCDLEMDLESGERGGRMRGVVAALRLLTGADAAIVVNNCAAAVLLALTSLAAGREVVVSRGELVEIGGSFRVPEVISSGGARLVEVGTTNRTRIADFERAIGPGTALLLRVHPSNFRAVGFCEAPSREAMAELAHSRNLYALEDLGSGSLHGEGEEPTVRDVIASGMDLVMFSGDKLLGGPQTGVIAGRADLCERLRSHPLYRALRIDKVSLAALEATLGDHLAGRRPPVRDMLGASVEALRARAERLALVMRGYGLSPKTVEVSSVAGGGALPGRELPSIAVCLPLARGHDALAKDLRTGTPPIVARVHAEGLLFDVRTVREEEVEPLGRRAAEAAIHREGG